MILPLLVRRAELIDMVAEIMPHKLTLPVGPERQRCNEDLILLCWEVREIDKELGNAL